jgi:type II secretory pathway component PulF
MTPDNALQRIQQWRHDATRWLYRHTFSTRDRLKLYEELAFLLENNQRLSVALENMRDTALSGGRVSAREAVWLNDILSGTRNGLSLDQALSGWVPRQECALISAGVHDSRLVGALKRAADVVRGIDDMKSAVFGQLAYPFVLVGVIVAIMIMIHRYFLPPLIHLFPEDTWDGAMWWLGSSANLVAEQGVFLALLAAMTLAWMVWSLPNVTGRPRRWMDRVMPWSLYQDFQGVVFLLNISALLNAGVPVLEALNKMAEHASPWLAERLNAIRRRVNDGDHLGLALRRAGYRFPSVDAVNKLALLTSEANSDNSQVIMERYAWYMLKSAITRMKKRINTVSGLLFAVCGSYMILMLLVIQQLNDMASQIGQ